MIFDKNKAYSIFRYKFSDEEKNQIKEIQNLKEDFANRGMSRSGFYVSAHRDLFEKHLKIKCDFLIHAFLESFSNNVTINNATQEKLIDELREFVKKEIEFKSNSIKEVLASTGLNKSGISTAEVSTLRPHFNEILNIKIEQLKHLIEKHNQTVLDEKKKFSFWNTKSGWITAIATAIIMLFTVLSILGVFKRGIKQNLPIIHSFDLSPNVISKGQSINLFWNVENADSVVLNFNIGKVSFSGSKLIYPRSSTNFILSAFLENKVLSVIKMVTVRDSLGNALQ